MGNAESGQATFAAHREDLQVGTTQRLNGDEFRCCGERPD